MSRAWLPGKPICKPICKPIVKTKHGFRESRFKNRFQNRFFFNRKINYKKKSALKSDFPEAVFFFRKSDFQSQCQSGCRIGCRVGCWVGCLVGCLGGICCCSGWPWRFGMVLFGWIFDGNRHFCIPGRSSLAALAGLVLEIDVSSPSSVRLLDLSFAPAPSTSVLPLSFLPPGISSQQQRLYSRTRNKKGSEPLPYTRRAPHMCESPFPIRGESAL